MKHANFVHLHVHTQYSLLDGAIRLEDLFKKAKAYAMPAIAITDHGNMFGAIDFYQTAYRTGIKPIIGCELYVAPGSRFSRESNSKIENARHIVVLARNIHGYRNLIKLTSMGYLEGFYYRPRVDKELLKQFGDGLIGLSACLHGEISEHLLRGDKESAAKAALEYRDIFGDGNFYLEIMENGIPEQRDVNRGLIELGEKLSIPIVATNDCHYLNPEDAEAHDILLCIQTGRTIEDADRMKFATNEFYLKPPEEMIKSFSYCPESIDNTVKIAEKCNLTLTFDNIFLPHFEIEQEKTLDEYLRDLAKIGLENILTGVVGEERDKYLKRLHQELDIIQSMGFSGYFLIVSDFINYAKKKNIPVGPGRGSVAGSLVAFALGITSIDPIRYGLFFERFLNPDRKSMPDIDTDFCIEGRDEIIRYVTNKYGSDHVAQIVTFGTMQAKQVIRDVGRALNMPYGEVDRIAKLVPNVLNIKLDEAIKMEPRLQSEERNSEKVRKLLSLSRSLEGLNRHSSTHAAGVVISDRPLVERVPLYKSQKEEVMTQFSMDDIQSVGLTKFDFLGLRTLTVIRDALDFIKKGRGIDLDINKIPLDDSQTYQLLMRGETDGVFQLESSGMKDIVVSMKPDCIEDIIALLSLYRPGPLKSGMVPEFISRKHGKTRIKYEVTALEAILKETYGVILYQEQVMQIASVLANYSMGEADTLRKVMSKKNPSEMEKEKPKFLAGARKNKIPEEKARKIFEQMATFAGYGFNKSHSAAYAMISYHTAYLKTHYPVEFMTALLTSEKNNRDKIIKYISSCKEMGIDVLPPDINESITDFSVLGTKIRFGLAAVKNVGAGAVDSIIESREKGGAFTSLSDLCRRVDLRKINKRVIESLIKCGAFDSFGKKRRQLMEGFDKIVEATQRRKKNGPSSQSSLFANDDAKREGGESLRDDEHLPDVPEWDAAERLAHEKETLGFYITGHPLLRFADQLQNLTDADSENIIHKRDGETVHVAGTVGNVKTVLTKKKDTMAYVTLEDMKGSIELIVFGDMFKKYSTVLQSGEPVMVTGTVDAGDENCKIIPSEILPLKEAIENPHSEVHFDVNAANATPYTLDSLKRILMKNRGKIDGFIHLHLNGKSETVIYLGKDLRLNPTKSLKKEADSILGDGSTRFL
jgi:DNA polymerase-3 subunit alpha